MATRAKVSEPKEPEIEPMPEFIEPKVLKLIHEYKGNNHRIVIGDRVGAWAAYASIAELDDFRASSDDRGEALWQITPISHLDYEVVRDKKE